MRTGLFFMAMALLACILCVPRAGQARVWSPPRTLSAGFLPGEYIQVERGADGTVAAVWFDVDIQAGAYLLKCAIAPGGALFGSTVTVASRTSTDTFSNFPSLCVTADGTAVLAWSEKFGAQERVMAWVKPRSGGATTGQLGAAAADIRSIHVDAGPSGGAAAAYTSCSTTTADSGPCDLYVARRPSASWLSPELVDSSATYGYDNAYIAMGATGLILASWAMADPASSEWAMLSNAFDPNTASWQATSTVHTSFRPAANSEDFAVPPALNDDDTAVLAWIMDTSTSSGSEAVYSTTRDPATGVWTLSGAISSTYAHSSLDDLVLEMRGGATAAVWSAANVSGDFAAWGNVREPGGAWGSDTQLSLYFDELTPRDLEISPDGSFLICGWTTDDDASIDAGDNSIHWNSRSTGGPWGGVNGSGSFVTKVEDAYSLVFELAADNTVMAVWSYDPTKATPGTSLLKWALRDPATGLWGCPWTLAEGDALITMIDIPPGSGAVSDTDLDPLHLIWGDVNYAAQEWSIYGSRYGAPLGGTGARMLLLE